MVADCSSKIAGVPVMAAVRGVHARMGGHRRGGSLAQLMEARLCCKGGGRAQPKGEGAPARRGKAALGQPRERKQKLG